MGQKVKPIGLRLGINNNWDSRWYANEDYGKLFLSDISIRNFLNKRLSKLGVSKIIIERSSKKTIVTICTSKPGVVIGKKGSDIEFLKRGLKQYVDSKSELILNILEVRKPEIDAKLVAENIAQQIEKRVSHRRAMKRAIQSAMLMGAEGIRVIVSGRLGGAEIARVEHYHEGRVPLHTLRACIGYGSYGAQTTYGVCGVKVWIYNGERHGYSNDVNVDKYKQKQKISKQNNKTSIMEKGE